MTGVESYVQNIKPIPVKLVKILVEFWARMASEKVRCGGKSQDSSQDLGWDGFKERRRKFELDPDLMKVGECIAMQCLEIRCVLFEFL